MPASGPPDPDSPARVSALYAAIHGGATADEMAQQFGIDTISEETRRALAAAPAPLHGEVRVGDVMHVLYSMGGVLVLAVRAVEADPLPSALLGAT